jgi:hypothetical protein
VAEFLRQPTVRHQHDPDHTVMAPVIALSHGLRTSPAVGADGHLVQWTKVDKPKFAIPVAILPHPDACGIGF